MEKENKKGKNLSKNFWYVVIAVCSILIVLVAVGFILFSNRKPTVLNETKDGGNVTLNYSSNVKGLSIINATPVTDVVGMKNSLDDQYFDFSVDVDLEDANSVDYEIVVEKNKGASTVDDKDIKIYLEKEKSGSYVKVFGPEKFTGMKEKSELGSPKGSMVVATASKIKSGTDNYRLRMWLSDTSLMTTGNYSVTVSVNGIAK